MKKVITGLMISGVISTSLFAGVGFEVGTKASKGSDQNIMGIQKISEIVGDGGQEIFIESNYKAGVAQVGLRYSNNSSEDEHKGELTWKINLSEKSESKLKYYVNGGFGFGFQGGKTTTLSTNITKAEYVSSSNLDAFKVPTKATIDDSTFISFSIGLGTSYNFTNNLKLNAGYEYERKSWDLNYKVAGKENAPVDLSGIAQNFHGVRASLEYRF
jgi:opacity protein-like surface antigen